MRLRDVVFGDLDVRRSPAKFRIRGKPRMILVSIAFAETASLLTPVGRTDQGTVRIWQRGDKLEGFVVEKTIFENHAALDLLVDGDVVMAYVHTYDKPALAKAMKTAGITPLQAIG